MRIFTRELTKPLKGLTVDERYALLLLGLAKAGLDEEAQDKIVAAVVAEKGGLDDDNSR